VNAKHVPGENRGKIVLYALSTCGWCARTKRLLNKLGVAYSYVDVDLLEWGERQSVLDEVGRWNPRRSFPRLVINDETCILGYDEQRIRGVLRL